MAATVFEGSNSFGGFVSVKNNRLAEDRAA